MKRIWSRWDTIIAAALAAAAYFYVPADAFRDVTTELIAFFSIQSAVILPAMIFTAGILKPDGLELSEARRYHAALKRQMQFWVVLLILDFVAIALLILGKASMWSLAFDLPFTPWRVDPGDWLVAILCFVGALAVLRTIPFVRGVISLLDLNSDMAQKAIQRRNRLEAAERASRTPPRPMSLPEGYGDVLPPGEPTGKPDDAVG